MGRFLIRPRRAKEQGEEKELTELAVVRPARRRVGMECDDDADPIFEIRITLERHMLAAPRMNGDRGEEHDAATGRLPLTDPADDGAVYGDFPFGLVVPPSWEHEAHFWDWCAR